MKKPSEKVINVFKEKGLDNAKMYAKFTQYYFPEFLEDSNQLSDTYFKFVNEVMIKNNLIQEVFKNDKKLVEISREIGITVDTLSRRLSRGKEKIRKKFDYYKANNMYLRFTRDYFPELYDEVESLGEKYRKFVEKAIALDPILIKRFKDNICVKDIAEEMHLSTRSVNSKLERLQRPIYKLYDDMFLKIKSRN